MHCRAFLFVSLSLALGGAAIAAATPGHAPPKRHRKSVKPHTHKAVPAKAVPSPAPSPALLPALPPSPTDTPRVSTMPVSDYEQVGWWRGDGSGVDDMKHSDGTIYGSVSYAPAMNGRGFRFTGSDDAVVVPDNPTLALTHAITINAWVNVDAYSTPAEDKGMIVFRGDDRGGLDPYYLSVGSDQRLLFHIESETDKVEISAPIPARRFVMVTALLDDSTGKMELYENTVLVARTVTRVHPLELLDPTQHPALAIGNVNAFPGGSGYRAAFHGVVNDLRLWRRVIAPGEMRSLYGDCLSVPSPLVPAASAP